MSPGLPALNLVDVLWEVAQALGPSVTLSGQWRSASGLCSYRRELSKWLVKPVKVFACNDRIPDFT